MTTRSDELQLWRWYANEFGKQVESSWRAAALALGAWARRNQFNIMFEVRRVRECDVLYVLMRNKRQ